MRIIVTSSGETIKSICHISKCMNMNSVFSFIQTKYWPVHLISIRSKMSETPQLATLDSTIVNNLPEHSKFLFDQKADNKLTFEEIAQKLGRSEVAVAAIFYGQAQASKEDIENLFKLFRVTDSTAAKALRARLETSLTAFPNRGHVGPMPPTEPLIYRLYEIVQNYGYAYKAILNEKFGDGIMSAISFSTKVEKETDEKGDWAVITLRGKWLPFTRF